MNPMIQINNNIRINKRRDIVFHFIANVKNIPLWNYYVNEVIRTPAEEQGKLIYKQIRKSDFQLFRISNQSYPEKIIFETTSESQLQFNREFFFEEVDYNSCIVYDKFELDLGYPKIVQYIFTRKIRSEVKNNLMKLKMLLETGATILQNGRISKLEKSYLKNTSSN
jgi:hypothetical protein